MKRFIVIADSDHVLLELLRCRCEFLGLNVETASSGDDAVAAIRQLRPQLVCVGQSLACASGQTVCEVLARDSHAARIPVIALTDTPDAQPTGACLELCAYVISRGGNLWHRIEPLIYELVDLPSSPEGQTGDAREKQELRIDSAPRTAEQTTSEVARPSGPSSQEDAREAVLDAVFEWFGDGVDADTDDTQETPHEHSYSEEASDPPWVLCIEDDADFSLALKLRLEAQGIAVIRAFDGTSGFRTAFTHPASAILLDYNLPQGQGDYVLRRLKENPVTTNVPVIVITGNRSTTIKRQMLSLGAEGYLTKPIDFRELSELLGRFVDMLPAEYSELACQSSN